MPRVRRRPELYDAFRRLPLFAHCTDDELAAIDAMADEVHIPAGKVLIREGEIGREFVVIIEGHAEVTCEGVVVNHLGPGDHLGELSLLSDHPRNATVTATTDITAQVIERRGFQTLIDETPHLAINLLKATATRLTELDEEFAHLRRQVDEGD